MSVGEEALLVLKAKRIAGKAQHVGGDGTIVTVLRKDAARARELLTKSKLSGEVVSRLYTYEFFCENCKKLLKPTAITCPRCREVRDAHGS